MLEAFEHIPVDKKVATIAGRLLSVHRALHGMDPLDALIAATALANEAVFQVYCGFSQYESVF